MKRNGSSILVAALSSAFGVGVLQVTGLLAAHIRANDQVGSRGSVTFALQLVAVVFIVIAVYVGAIVTANTVATVVAGRARSIALLRLLGSTARSQRDAIAREGLLVGVIGAAIGVLIGTALALGLETLAEGLGLFPPVVYSYIAPVLLLPVLMVVLTTWLAAWVGSRRVLSVTPLQALGGSEELSREAAAHKPMRNRSALALGIVGIILLVLGLLVGLFISPVGVLVGLIGGILSFTGLVFGADLIMPPALRLVGRWFGHSAPARLASENALRYPQRSSRATIGVVIGVTLITMLGVAVASFDQIIQSAQLAQPEVYRGTEQLLSAITIVFSILIGFSGLIAAVGLVNNLSLTVLQRTRELGLLRALGFSVSQVRRMIFTESAQLTITAVVLGLVLGAMYGWVGAQSLLGRLSGHPGLIVPGVPWLLFGVIGLAAVVLAAIASWAPTRRATRISPVAALAVE